MLGACFVSVIGNEVGSNEVTELGLWDGKVLGATFRAIGIFSFVNSWRMRAVRT